MKHIPWILIPILLVLTGCNLVQGTNSKKVIQHPAPELEIDNSYFSSLGCFDDPACLQGNLRDLEYPIGTIAVPDNVLGGLDPSFPLAVVTNFGFDPEDEIPSVYVNRCMIEQYVRYLVVVEDEIKLVDSTEELAAIYAPIDSENEAFSYAIAATGLSAVNYLHSARELKYYVINPEESYVKATSKGYMVHLYDTYLCGCGPHIVQSVDVSVSTDGTISLSDAVDVYSNPETDGLCID